MAYRQPRSEAAEIARGQRPPSRDGSGYSVSTLPAQPLHRAVALAAAASSSRLLSTGVRYPGVPDLDGVGPIVSSHSCGGTPKVLHEIGPDGTADVIAGRRGCLPRNVGSLLPSPDPHPCGRPHQKGDRSIVSRSFIAPSPGGPRNGNGRKLRAASRNVSSVLLLLFCGGPLEPGCRGSKEQLGGRKDCVHLPAPTVGPGMPKDRKVLLLFRRDQREHVHTLARFDLDDHLAGVCWCKQLATAQRPWASGDAGYISHLQRNLHSSKPAQETARSDLARASNKRQLVADDIIRIHASRMFAPSMNMSAVAFCMIIGEASHRVCRLSFV